MENKNLIDISKLVEFSKSKEGKQKIITILKLLEEPINKNEWAEALTILQDLNYLLFNNLIIELMLETNEENTQLKKNIEEEEYGDFTYY